MAERAQLKSILCVDDQSDILLLIELWLGKFTDANIYTCTSGREALAQVVAMKPDLILLDLMMPDMDGIATLAALRRSPDAAPIPVILMTADDDPDLAGRLDEMGVLGLLRKPFNPLGLRKAVSTLWAKHQFALSR